MQIFVCLVILSCPVFVLSLPANKKLKDDINNAELGKFVEVLERNLHKKSWKSEEVKSIKNIDNKRRDDDQFEGWPGKAAIQDVETLEEPEVGRYKRSFPYWVNRWPNGEIFYTIDSNIGSSTVVKINEAISRFNSYTCVQFIPRNGEANYVRLTSGGSCYSGIGYRSSGGEHILYISDSCSIGTIIHEFLHQIGLIHEQNRDDRDRHITVRMDRLNDDAKNSFKEFINMEHIPGDNYDISSVMHYPLQYYSNNGLPEMESVDPDLGFLAARYIYDSQLDMSFYDIKRVMTYYQCVPGTCNKVCQNTGFLDKNCNCVCPSGLTGTLCEVKEGDADCGGIITLTNGQSHDIQSPGYPNNYGTGSTNGKRCVWLIKGEANSRIRATILDYNVQCTVEQVQIKYNLLGQEGPSIPCGLIPARTEYVTRLNQGEHDKMMILLNSMTGGASASKFHIRVEAFQSGCYGNPCRDGSLCTEGPGDGSYTCNCLSGYSGADCSSVTALSTVTCGFEFGYEKDCFLQPVAQAKDYGTGLFNFVHYHNWGTTVTAAEGDFMLVQKSDGESAWFGDESILESWTSFEASDRCLRVLYSVSQYSSSITNEFAKLIIKYSGKNNPETEIANTGGLQSTAGTWVELKVNIPSVEDLKILIIGVYHTNFLSIDGVRLTPGACGTGNPVCDPNIEYLDPNTNQCASKRTHGGACVMEGLSTECLYGLICSAGSCSCSNPNNQYWYSQTRSCLPKKNRQASCSNNEECLPLFVCDGTCDCPTTQQWTGTTCVNVCGMELLVRLRLALEVIAHKDKFVQMDLYVLEAHVPVQVTSSGKVPHVLQIGFGGDCSQGQVCSGELGCSGGLCSCTNDKFWQSSSCVPKIGFGGDCSQGQVCSGELVCSRSLCSCTSDKYWQGSSCVLKVGYGGDCSQGQVCSGQFVCTGGSCSCTSDKYWQGSSCVLKGGHLDTCIQGVDSCTSPLACQADNTCNCPSPLVWNNGICEAPSGGNILYCGFEEATYTCAMTKSGPWTYIKNNQLHSPSYKYPYTAKAGSGYLFLDKAQTGSLTYTPGVAGTYCFKFAYSVLGTTLDYIKAEQSGVSQLLLSQYATTSYATIWWQFKQTLTLQTNSQLKITATTRLGTMSEVSVDEVSLTTGPCT